MVQDVAVSLWGAPVPSRTKDYIAEPKPNGYQSIHLTIDPLTSTLAAAAVVPRPLSAASDERSSSGMAAAAVGEETPATSPCHMELQIRTRLMDDLAEAGEASHSSYKGGLDSRQARQLREWTHQLRKQLSASAGAGARTLRRRPRRTTQRDANEGGQILLAPSSSGDAAQHGSGCSEGSTCAAGSAGARPTTTCDDDMGQAARWAAV